MVPKKRAEGKAFEAIEFGPAGKALAFEVVEKNGKHSLKAVTTTLDDADAQHADHHPTDRIYQTPRQGIAVPGKKLDGEVKTGDPMLSKVVQMIKSAKKPVIIAGQGCNDSPEELKAFAEALQIPVTTTLHALGVFDERHPLALNMMGMHGHPTPNYMVQESDLIINIGSRFDDRITGKPSHFIPEARKAAEEGRGGVIHVDIRRSQNGLQVEPTYFVHSTAKKFLQTVNAEIDANPPDHTLTGDWLRRMDNLQHEVPVLIPRFPTEEVEVTYPDGSTSIDRTNSNVLSACDS